MAADVRSDRPATGRRLKTHRRNSVLAIAGVAAFVVLAVGAGFVFRTRTASPRLAGGTFTDTPAAPEFSLTDQNGRTVTMSSTLGKVVAVTFLYTHCPDICPTIANKMAGTVTQLGAQASSVEMLAVSMDPRGDTFPAIKKFTADHGLDDYANWHYLIGSPSQLSAVWEAYHVGVEPSQDPSSVFVGHSALLYIVDKQGKLRVLLDANFSPGDFLKDIRALLGA